MLFDGEWLTDKNRINHPLIDYSKKFKSFNRSSYWWFNSKNLLSIQEYSLQKKLLNLLEKYQTKIKN